MSGNQKTSSHNNITNAQNSANDSIAAVIVHSLFVQAESDICSLSVQVKHEMGSQQAR